VTTLLVFHFTSAHFILANQKHSGDNGLKFGLILPALCPTDAHHQTPSLMLQFAERAEELGFDSLFTLDEPIATPDEPTSLDSIATLMAVGVRTKKVKIGSSIFILPLYNPVLLAKTVATMDYLLEGRFIFGVGVSSDRHEKLFEAVGVSARDRGARADEQIEIMKKLWTGKEATYEGRFYKVRGITLEPVLQKPPPLWCAGGTVPGGKLSRSVADRIAKADGWITPALATPDMIQKDWKEISSRAEQLGRNSSEIEISHTNFLYAVETSDRKAALEKQRPVFADYMGESWEECQSAYFTGTLDDINDKIRRLEELGVKHMLLGPISLEIEQLDLIADEIMPNFR
jgi:alkanesulfonate monooxygenase SsuD/methylene tetrahydromethanopterin reductase-like flavin-dependent oxidoreductase (luciferase family)